MAQPIALLPGRTMTRVLTRPSATSTKRMGDTCSPRKRVASRVTTSGVVMASAVYSPTGRYFRLKKASICTTNSRPPRARCRPG